MNAHRLCPTVGCLRSRITDGRYCDAHTREYLSNAFRPEWVKRAQGRELPTRIEGGAAR